MRDLRTSMAALARCPQCRQSSLTYLSAKHIILELDHSGMPVKKWWLSCFAPSVCRVAQAWSRQTVKLAWSSHCESCLRSPECWRRSSWIEISANAEETNGFPAATASAPSVPGNTIKRKSDSSSNKYANSGFLQQGLGGHHFPLYHHRVPKQAWKCWQSILKPSRWLLFEL